MKQGAVIVGAVKLGTKIAGGMALAGAAAAAVGSYGAFGRSAQVFGRSVYRGAGRRRSVALTFDDGPSPATPALLEYLAEQGVQATFFQCGMNVLRHREIAKRVFDAGHEIGNHTFSHPRLCPRLGWKPNLRSPGEIYRELAETQEILTSLSGVAPKLFRAPYGMRWWGLGAAQRRLGLLGVLWTVIAHDWAWPSGRIAPFVLDGVRPGGILCFHDGRDIQPEVDARATMAALKVIVPALRDRGYAFETVSQLLRPDPVVNHR